MRIVIGNQSFGSAQLTKAMRALYASPNNLRYEPVSIVCDYEDGEGRGWRGFVNGYVGPYAAGPWLALCAAARRAGYEVKEGR